MLIRHRLVPPDLGARSAKVVPGFASDRAPNQRKAHDLFAKPLTLWRIMRGS